MNKLNVDQALLALAEALKNSQPDTFLDNPKEFVKKIPFRSLSGDHINGGKILNFSSGGISDKASKEQISISDDGVVIPLFSNGFEVKGKIQADHVKTTIIEADEIRGNLRSVLDGPIEFGGPIIFEGDNIEGKGILWPGQGYTKQFIFASNPDRIFLSENLDLSRGKNISINNLKIIDETSLGTSITKSYLREVGRLKGLIVEGSATLGEYFHFDGNSNRFGIGTEQPNATVSILENDIELVLGTKNTAKAFVGTYASHGLELITDNQSRITISPDGNITLGNFKSSPVQVSINGKLAVRVNNPDPDVDLQVNGSVKFGGKLQMNGSSFPDGGSFNKGDIVWNNDPRIGSYVGWICTLTGTPGLWEPFGKIGHQ